MVCCTYGTVNQLKTAPRALSNQCCPMVGHAQKWPKAASANAQGSLYKQMKQVHPSNKKLFQYVVILFNNE